MYELVKVSENCFYIQSPTKIGIVRCAEDLVCLIDSGNDKDAGKKIKRILDANGWTLQAIYNTHSHADHIGGNQYLQKQTGCRIYVPEMERTFAEHPILEPSFLFGSNPPSELRHKFLMAQKSDALPLTGECLPEGMEILPLPGHSWNMVGFRTKDDVVYLADCLSSRTTLEKYQISFLTDVGAYLETLEMVQNMEAGLFIPAHAEAVEDIAPLAKLNIQKVHEISEEILEICREPVSFETVLSRIFDHYQLRMNFEQHALVGCTVKAYLTWLKEQGRLQVYFEDNRMLWQG